MSKSGWATRATWCLVSMATLAGCEELPAEFDPNERDVALDAGPGENKDPLAVVPGADAGDAGLIDANMVSSHTDGGQALSALYTQVYAVMAAKCLDCHGATKTLDLSTPELAREELVGVMAEYKACVSDAGPPRVRVIAGAPGSSLLMEKLEGTQTCGKPMPPSGMLSAQDTELFRKWIAAGAKLR
jgi:mono/diheme cytochrome c family protein